MSSKERCLFCFPGASYGTVVIKWLQEQGYDVIVYIPDVGQKRNLRDVQRHVQEMGCVVILDSLMDEFVQNYLYPALQAKVDLGISLSAPCIAKRQIEIAKQQGCGTIAHGRQGDALIQFEMILYSLDATINIISPWTDKNFYSRFPSEETLKVYVEANKLYVPMDVGNDATDLNMKHHGGRGVSVPLDFQTTPSSAWGVPSR